MTTITFDGVEVAADRSVSASGEVITGQATKLFRRADGALIALLGDASIAQGFSRWFLAGEEEFRKPTLLFNDETTALIVIFRTDGSIEEHTPAGWHHREGDQLAWGCGKEGALCAMAAGASAKQAIEITSRFCPFTSFETDVFKLKRKPRAVRGKGAAARTGGRVR